MSSALMTVAPIGASAAGLAKREPVTRTVGMSPSGEVGASAWAMAGAKQADRMIASGRRGETVVNMGRRSLHKVSGRASPQAGFNGSSLAALPPVLAGIRAPQPHRPTFLCIAQWYRERLPLSEQRRWVPLRGQHT